MLNHFKKTLVISHKLEFTQNPATLTISYQHEVLSSYREVHAPCRTYKDADQGYFPTDSVKHQRMMPLSLNPYILGYATVNRSPISVAYGQQSSFSLGLETLTQVTRRKEIRYYGIKETRWSTPGLMFHDNPYLPLQSEQKQKGASRRRHKDIFACTAKMLWHIGHRLINAMLILMLKNHQ